MIMCHLTIERHVNDLLYYSGTLFIVITGFDELPLDYYREKTSIGQAIFELLSRLWAIFGLLLAKTGDFRIRETDYIVW